MSNDRDSYKTVSTLQKLGATVVITFIVMMILYFRTFPIPFSGDQSHWGAFGDFVGGLLNPFVAFLALMALIKTVSIQQDILNATTKQWNDLNRIAEKQINDFNTAHNDIMDGQEKERKRLITKEFIDEFFSQEFTLHRSAIWNIEQKVIKDKSVSVEFIVNGFLQTSIEHYFVGEEYNGFSEHNHLTLYLGFVDRLGYSIKTNALDKAMLKAAIGYEMRWHIDFIRALAEVAEDKTKNASEEARPSFIEHVDKVYNLVGRNSEMQPIPDDRYRISDDEKASVTESLAVIPSKDKRDLAIKLRSEWGQESMRNNRLSAWAAFQIHYGEVNESASQIYVSDLKRNFTETEWRSATEVFLFFSDLEKLLSHDLVDREITIKLLQNSIEPWFWYINRLEYDLGNSDYHINVGEWYKNHVKGLCKIFQN